MTLRAESAGALVILGMHRSGTSLVAQACAAAGISPGPEEGLLSAQEDNPEGFFENRQLVECNDELLASVGSSWFRPPSPGSALATADVGESRLSDVLAHIAGGVEGSFFLKDPRLCLTWPAWKKSLANARFLFVYRSPLAVARSLARRNAFPLQYGLALWEIYNRRALAVLAGAPEGVTVSYDQLFRGEVALEAVLEEVAVLGLPCAPGAAAAVFKAERSHFRPVAEAEDSDWPLLTDSQVRLHRFCERLCRAETRASAFGPDCAETLEDEARVLARIGDYARALEPLADIVATKNERDDAVLQKDRAMESLHQLEADHTALSTAHEHEKRLHETAASTLKTLEADHAALAKSHAGEVARHQSLQAAHTKVQQELAERGQELLAVHAQRERLEDELRVSSEKADYLFFALTESFRALIAFEQSTLATVQRYARRAYRLVTLQRGRNSAYEDVLERAHEHFSEFDLALPEPRPNKLSMARDVLAYVLRNPAGSARSFSWARLRRAAQVFFGSSADELSVWVQARFPDTETGATGFDPAALDPGLDALELEFPATPNPRVSIIIPVFNDYRVTVNCLRAIHEHTPEPAYEVILGDDCSTDLTKTIGERIRGLSVSRTPENLRFLRNCNLAAESARGDILVFLNNDTAVTPGWLDALLEPFADAGVGITGPKLLFADGSLQEAGGLIWRDASGWNFGRGDDPDKPAFTYRREVDYVSGACLAIRRDLWAELRGFDERFAPAYYEDADLCFAARAAGYRVIYQPHSVVYHFEGVSNGTDLESGVKQHQVTNQAVFRDKWQAILDAEHFPNGEAVIAARDRSRGKPCVLVIDHYVPHYDRDAGGRSTYMYLKVLLELGCRVQFMGANFFPHAPYTRELQSLGIEVLVGESIARHLDRWLAEHAPFIDHVFLHRPHVAEQFLPHLERLRPRPMLHYVGHDLHYLRFEREAALKDDEDLRREGKRWEKRELAVCDRCDRVYYFSDVELEALEARVAPAKLRRLPLYAMALEPLPPYAPSCPQELLFVGGYNHPPNVDAATWLARDILPLVRREMPGAHLHLVGSNPTPAVLDLAGAAVTVHGYVSDAALTALYRKIGAAVVPLQYGAGVKGKVIEAIAHHVPLVTTDIGAEGIPDAEEVMWIENTTEAIARRIAGILSGAESVGARLDGHEAWLSRHFDREQAADCLREAIPGLGASGNPEA